MCICEREGEREREREREREMGLLLCVNNYCKNFDISLSVIVTFVIFALVQNWSTLIVCHSSFCTREVTILLCDE